jgi:hypothetical protein
MNLLILLAEAITKDGGISADWILGIVVVVCTALVSIIFTFILNSINSIKADVKEIRDDFHTFVEEQKGLNATLHERTKNL